MIHKKILNGLTLSLMLTLISNPAHAGWFSWIGDYFNKPSKNALVATTAIAGVSLLATFACALNWWKTSKLSSAKDALIQQKENDNISTASRLLIERQQFKDTLETTEAMLAGKTALIRVRERQLAQARTQVDQLTDTLNQEWTQAQQNGNKVREEFAAKDAHLADEQYKLYQRNVTLERIYRAQIKVLEMENDTLKDRLEKLKPYEKQNN